MAAVLGRTKVGVRETGVTATVPDNPRANLMYYLECICSVLDLNDHQNLDRLRNYSEYYLLTEEETDALVGLCYLLSPDELNGKVIFQDDEMCKDMSNNFYELSAVSSSLLISESVLIGGQHRAVKEIMTYKMAWVNENWVIPMRHFAPRLAVLAAGQRSEPRRRAIASPSQPLRDRDRSSDSNGCCIIL